MPSELGVELTHAKAFFSQPVFMIPVVSVKVNFKTALHPLSKKLNRISNSPVDVWN
jgi:hypothetical protein